MKDAIKHLAQVLTCEVVEAPTHFTLIINGWNVDSLTKKFIAKYLVGLRSCAIDAALNIRAQIEDAEYDRLELIKNVDAIIGRRGVLLSDDKKQDERNPWIAEGMWHLCMVLSADRPEIHPFGSIVALDYAHVATKDHGLDVVAIYEREGLFGLSLVESKAYKSDPNKAINNAVDFFRAVDRDEHALRIRQSVQVMRMAIPAEKQELISKSFWKRTRSYIPNPHYDSQYLINWSIRRPSFSTLVPGKPNILVMPHVINNFDAFFDEVSNEMREYVQGL